jgi:outer membrane lipoprotein-sorting protein
MKKYLSLIALFLFFTSSAFSQNKKAESLLEEVRAKTESYRSIKIDFTYEMINEKADIHETEEGELLVKGDKYRLNIAGQTVINDGETIWTYIGEANEVQINTVEEDDESIITPTNLLNSYSENYKPKFVEETTLMGYNVMIIELKPIEEKSYDFIELKVEKTKKRVLQITIVDKSANHFRYTVNEFKPNVLFHHTDFQFNPEDYPDVEIIDMR